MKTSFICLLLAFLFFNTFAQAPDGFNYQGIARDNTGKELPNKNISLRLSVLANSATGTVICSESQIVVTNSFGLFTVKIGTGSVISGNFKTIAWSSGLYFLKVDMDLNGGTNYSFIGTSQLLSVPYSLMSNLSLKSLNDLDTSPTNELQILKLSNDTLYLDRGGFVYLGGYDDKNAIQQIKTKLNSDSTFFDVRINDETTVRQNNDNSLNLKIQSDSNYLKGLIFTNETNLNNETNSRIIGDQSLKTKQVSDSSYLRTTINTTNTNLTTETNSRITGDNNLKSKMVSDSIYLKGLNTTEATNRTNADNNLMSKILDDSTYLKGEINSHNSLDHDTSSINEIQSLRISNDTIFLLNGGYVKLPAISSLVKSPSVITNSATNVLSSSATLTGIVNSNGFLSTAVFEYGTTSSYGNSIIASQNPVIGSSNTNVSASISGLVPYTTYHYRLNASNAVNISFGFDSTFLTQTAPPNSITLAATRRTSNSATLNGNVNPNGLSTTVTFEYGTTTSYGNSVAAIQSPVTGNSNTDVNNNITSLSSGTTYHFRVKAINSHGTTYGNDSIFTTPNTVTDIDGYVYNTVIIGTQVWMVENLKTTRYRNGDAIPNITAASAWLNQTTGARCYLSNDSTNNASIYGAVTNQQLL